MFTQQQVCLYCLYTLLYGDPTKALQGDHEKSVRMGWVFPLPTVTTTISGPDTYDGDPLVGQLTLEM